MGVAYFFIGVRSTAFSVGIPVVVLSIAACGFVLLAARKKGAVLGSGKRADRRLDAALAVAYLAVGVAVGLFVFVLPLDGPASSVQTYDNVHHFASVRSFSDSGMWSSLHVSSYLGVSDPAANPLPGTGYYPSGWYIVCSMVVSALGVEVALAVNAVNFLFAAIVFPLSMAFLMKVLFSGDRAIALIGALGAVAVGAFPWVLVEVWPLYPNTAAFALVPVLVACFAAVWGRDASRRERVAYGAVFVLGCCCMAFMQPNAVFSAAVFLIPFCVYRSAVEAGRRCREPKRRMEVMLAAGSVALACVALLWVAALSLPFMQGAVAVYWPPIHSRAQGLVSVLGMGFAGSSVHVRSHRASSPAGAAYTLQTTLSLADVLVSSGMLHLLRFGRGGDTSLAPLLKFRSICIAPPHWQRYWLFRFWRWDCTSRAESSGRLLHPFAPGGEPFEERFLWPSRLPSRLPRIELLARFEGARTRLALFRASLAPATALNDGQR